MAKRIVSLALCALVLLSCLSVPQARGMEDAGIAEAAYITVNLSGYERRVQVFTWEEDLLFSARDLADLSGFVLKSTPEAVSLTRGAKEIRVERSSGKLTCSLVSGSKILKSPVLELGGETYLSGAELLPWLNVGMKFEDGILYMVPNPVSLWDFAGEINLKDYGFSDQKCTEIMGISSKELNAILYMERNDSVIFSALNLEDFAETKEYYELLDDFFLDKSGSDAAIAELTEGMDVVTGLGSGVGQILDVMVPGLGEVLDTLGDIGKGAVRLYTYCTVFEADNTMQLNIMRSLKACRNYQYNQNMLDAVQQIIDTYTDYWSGLNYQTAYDLAQCEVENLEELTGQDLFRAFKMNWTDAKIDNTWLERFGCYRNLSGIGLQVCRKGWGSGNFTELENYICHAMLYLYMSEQCYQGIIQYMMDNGYREGFTRDMVLEMYRLAYRNDELYGKFLAASMYISYDRVSFKTHSGDYEMLVQSFAHLQLRQSDYGPARTAEMAVYMAALQDMNIPGLRWTMADIDRDGAYEYILDGFFQDANPWEPSILVLDGMHMGMFTPLGAAGMAGLTQAEDGGMYYVRYGYYSAMEQAEMIFAWNGGRWSPILRWEGTVEEIDGEYRTLGTYQVDGREADQEEHDRVLLELNLEDSFELSNADPLEHTVPGDPEENFKLLDRYYEDRDGYLQTLSADLEGDGDSDRVYAILGAADLWKENAAMEECHGGEIPFLFRDMALTLVVAENLGDSVRLRVCRLPGEGDATPVTIVDGQLLYQGNFYHYQTQGNPFPEETESPAQIPSLAEMAGMPYSVIRDQDWDVFWTEQDPDFPEEWTANASAGSCSYTFRFLDSMKEDPNDCPYLLTVQYYGTGESSFEVGDGVMLGMTYFRIRTTTEVSELLEAQLGWIAEYYPRGYSALLRFDTQGANAPLVAAEIYVFD